MPSVSDHFPTDPTGLAPSVAPPVVELGDGATFGLTVVENHGDRETTVHWHGLRLDNRYDGTHVTQEPIEVGQRFRYRLEFPDPGVYWYHPHVRQDYGQELGLYGAILVAPAEPDYWPPAHRELVVDILLDVSHPGRWMAHCHIAEHHESGMVFAFDVAPHDTAG